MWTGPRPQSCTSCAPWRSRTRPHSGRRNRPVTECPPVAQWDDPRGAASDRVTTPTEAAHLSCATATARIINRVAVSHKDALTGKSLVSAPGMLVLDTIAYYHDNVIASPLTNPGLVTEDGPGEQQALQELHLCLCAWCVTKKELSL